MDRNMAQYDDLTKYCYCNRQENNTVNIGWIENSPFRQGDVTQDFILNLWEYIKFPIYLARGIYRNIYLDNRIDSFIACFEEYQILLGTAEIRVINSEKTVIYAAPNLILHYILNHNYLPPEEFIEAVINGAKPNSEEYATMVANIYNSKKYLTASKLTCPYCDKNYNYVISRIKNQSEKNPKIQVIKKTLLLSNDNECCNEFNIICEKCGRMFEISIEDIKNCEKY